MEYPGRTKIKTKFDKISIPTELEPAADKLNCPLLRFERKTPISSALTVGEYNERPKVRARVRSRFANN